MKLCRYIIVSLIAGTVMYFSTGCSHNNPSVAGDWTLYSVQDSMISQGQILVYSYSSSNSVLYEYSAPPSPGDSTSYAYQLQFDIQTNGSYLITEALPWSGQADTFTNSWSVSNNNVLTINGIVNTNGQDPVVFGLANNSNEYVLARLDAHTMQLSQNWSYSSANSGQQRSVCMMTFKR